MKNPRPAFSSSGLNTCYVDYWHQHPDLTLHRNAGQVAAKLKGMSRAEISAWLLIREPKGFAFTCHVHTLDLICLSMGLISRPP